MKRWQTSFLFSGILSIWISMLILPMSAKAQQQMIKTPVQAPLSTKQVSIESITPKPINLIVGGQEVAVTITGANVNKITAVQVIQRGKLAPNFEARIGRPSATSMPVYLKAKAEAKLGTYQLRIIAGAQSIDVPINVLTIEVKASTTHAQMAKTPMEKLPGPVQQQPAQSIQAQNSPLVFTDCKFEQRSNGFYNTVTLKNTSSTNISFAGGQIVARSTGPAGVYNHTAPGGGQYFAPNGTMILTAFLGNLIPGQYNVVWEADPNRLYTTTAMLDKSRTCSLTVEAQPPAQGPLPDLIISDIVINPPSGTPTTVFSFTIYVKNIGQAPTTGSVSQIPKCFINGGAFSGPTYQNAPNNPIQPGQSLSYLRTRNAGMIPGTHSIQCTTDYWKEVAETNETNNSLTKSFSVHE
jgi:hypothetical protein